MTRGTIVTINFGSFSGLSGVVVFSSPVRTVVRVFLDRRSVLVELDTDMIRVPLQSRIKRPTDLQPHPQA